MIRQHFTIQLLMLVLFLFCPLVPVWAVKVTNLYHITVPVASQLEDQRALAESDGFLKVLIRLTGDQQIAKNPVIKSSLYRAEYYVRDYSYSPPSPASAEYLMKIQYEPDDVTRILKKAGVPFWTDSRPLTLAWVTYVDGSGQPDIINNDSTMDIYELIRKQSKKFGVALIFPVMDVDEISTVSSQMVMDMSLPELKKASKRYSPDVLLIGQIYNAGGQVTGKWNLVMNASMWEWNVSGKSAEEMVNAAFAQIAMTMVRQYTTGDKNSDGDASWVKVIVTNLGGDDDLTRLMQFMNRLAPVEKLQLSSVKADTAELYLLIDGTIEGFQKNVSGGQRLLLKASDQTAKKMTYQWVR